MNYKQALEYSSYFFFFTLALFACFSKAPVELSFAFLILISTFYLLFIDKHELIRDNRHMVILLFPLAVGFCISFFSMGGAIKGAVNFLERYRFFLLILPFTLFVRSEKHINFLFVILNLSAFIAIVYGAIHLKYPYIWCQSFGLHPILREANVLMSLGLINLAAIFGYRMENKTRHIALKILLSANTVLILSAVILMMRRSAYMGFSAGVFAFLLVTRKWKTLTLIILALCASLYFSNSVVTQRVKSITEFKNDPSNRERIQLFRTGFCYLIDEGLFFYGTGGKMSTEPYKKYFYSHSEEYQAKNNDIIHKNYFGNFHNSFLQMAVEYGLFFPLCYLACIFYLLFHLYRSLSGLTGNRKVYPVAAIVVTLGVFLSQFFHTGLYSYSGIPYVLTFAAGCHVVNRQRRNLPETDMKKRAATATGK